MKIRFVIFFLFLGIFASAQQYQPLVDSNKVWSSMSVGTGFPSTKSTGFYKCSGDTLINGEVFQKLLCAIDSMQQTYQLEGFIREDSSRKVFYQRKQDTVAYMIYDFGLEVGDTVITWGIIDTLFFVQVDSIDSVLIYGDYKQRVCLSSIWGSYLFETWIEGIGCEKGLLNSGDFSVGCFKYLLCYWENDTLKYHHPSYSECYYNNVGIDEDSSTQSYVTISPNPVSTSSVLRIDDKLNKKWDIYIYDMQGRHCKSISLKDDSYIINKSEFVSGMYFYKAISEDKSLLSGKFIIQ